MADELIKIEIDTKSFEKQLGEHKKKMPTIARKMMRKVNTKIKQEAKKIMRSRGYDKSKENGVYKNLFSWAGKNFAASIFIKRQAGLPYYAPFIKYGATITPKNGKYLTFFCDGSWHKMKQVSLEPKPFLGDLIKNYFESGKAKQIMEEVFQKELDKIYKKDK